VHKLFANVHQAPWRGIMAARATRVGEAEGWWMLMRRTILLLTLMTAVLLLGSGASQAATKTYTDKVLGVEISAGQIVDQTRMGATFVGQADGQLPGLLYASINYTPPRPGPNAVNTIVGGRWHLIGSWGSLHGSFAGGEVRWNSAGTRASVDTEMVIDGGTVRGKAVSGGGGSFVGTLSHLTFPPTLEGTLTLSPRFGTASASG
jgi:hypothetical protein